MIIMSEKLSEFIIWINETQDEIMRFFDGCIQGWRFKYICKLALGQLVKISWYFKCVQRNQGLNRESMYKAI